MAESLLSGPAVEFLDLACLTYDGTDSPERRTLAVEILAKNPGLTGESLLTAAAAADLAAVQRFLSADADSASAAGGPRGWEPLQYLAFSRVTGGDPVGVTAALLAAGADPGARWFEDGTPTPFTVLTGIFGSGEQGIANQPAHPDQAALARLVLQAGADPNDEQVLYNRMFYPDDSHLELLHEFGLGSTEASAELLRQQLIWACVHDFVDRVQLVVGWGAELESPLAIGYTPLELAVLSGADRVRELLQHQVSGELEPEFRAVSAALAGDLASVEAEPEGLAAARIRFPSLVLRAAVVGRAAAVELVADLGFDVDALGRSDLPIEEPWQTALHHAAGEGDLALIRLLLELGADASIKDRRFGSTPAEWAAHFGHTEARELIDAGVPDMIDEKILAELGFDLDELRALDPPDDALDAPDEAPDPRP